MKSLKNLFLVLGCTYLFTAQAAVYQCTIDQDNGLLLALSNNSGVIIKNEKGNFSPLSGKVKYATAPGNGPTIVLLQSPEPTIKEWSLNNDCFVTGTNYKVTLKVDANGNVESSLQLTASLYKNPNRLGDTSCDYPIFSISPIRKINCKLLQ
ncbi:MAG: hypothetical protein QE271_00740 [Bacteriovoracaceae bacterium]|nr:hypothetical protein [Bacteriovoracaceae bacterium]